MKIRTSPTAIQNLCLMVVATWALTPQLAFSGLARLVAIAAIGLWLMIEVWRPNGVIRAPTLPVLAMFVYSIYTLFFEMMTHGATGIISSLQLYIMLFFLVAQQARRRDMDSLLPTFWLVIVLTALWTTTTYVFLSTVDARAMRVLVRSTDEARDLVEQGVGGYGMAYGAVLMLPVLTVLSLRPSLIDHLHPPRILRLFRAMPRLIIWYLTAISFVLVLASQFSTAVLVVTVSVLITLVMWKMTNIRLLMAVSLSAFVVFFGEALLVDALLLAQRFAEGTNYLLKINDLLYSLQVGDADGTAADRVERYVRSLSLFLEAPVMGVLYYTDVGKHSTLLDGFARWGFVFGSMLVYLVSFQQIRAFRAVHGVRGGAGAALGALVAVLLAFGLNKHFMSAGIVIYIIYPFVFAALKESRAPNRSFQGSLAHA